VRDCSGPATPARLTTHRFADCTPVDFNELRSAFLSALSGGAFQQTATVDADLRARIDAGREAWPELGLDDLAFARHLAAHTHESLPPLKYAADLWLACACATGAKGAVAAFEKEHGATMQRAVSRVNRGLADEVRQAVMISLLVREPGRSPRIAEYGGRAALRTWLATVATNAALNQAQERANRAYESVGALGLAAAGLGPELALARAQNGEALDTAFREALGALDKRRRVLLRLHHVQGWTVGRLATMYRVSRATAGRLVVDARTALLDDTKRRLQERLKLTPSELESLLAALESNIQVSLVRILDQ
jgi:RNA polymerase sigma-70 factor (ECF subfamily)